MIVKGRTEPLHGKAIYSVGLFTHRGVLLRSVNVCIVVYSVYGPMAHDVDTLVEFLRAMMVPYMWKLDPSLVPMPFREEVCT